MSPDPSRRALVLVSAASLLCMSPWFSATVVLPQLEKLWQADIGLATWLTMAVRLLPVRRSIRSRGKQAV